MATNDNERGDSDEMTNAETAAHLREWVTRSHDVFGWPTDACGYHQHIRFVVFRNTRWAEYCNDFKLEGTSSDFNAFVLQYANWLDEQPEVTE